MGLPIARKCLEAGHEVGGFDLDRHRVEQLGAAAWEREEADVLVCSLPDAEAVEQVAARVAERGRPPVFVDMSTSPPSLARRLYSELADAGVASLDAPVSGGPMGAEAATLTVMVGGDAATFEHVRPVFDAVGRLVVHVGGPGSGQAAKLCNNLIAGATMAALAEACALAAEEGIDPRVLYELLSASTGDSRVLRNRFPLAGVADTHPSSRDWTPLFALDLMVKDLRLALALAAEKGIDATVAQAALAEYETAQVAGHGGLDYSGVFLAVKPEAN
jgi:3-hydroxyisobutyrate dehydrogenase